MNHYIHISPLNKDAMFYPTRRDAEMNINSNMYLGQTRILTCLLSNQSLSSVCKHWLKMHTTKRLKYFLEILRITSKLITIYFAYENYEFTREKFCEWYENYCDLVVYNDMFYPYK